MEAKEKAQELFNKCKPVSKGYVNSCQYSKACVKNCALVLVEEMILEFEGNYEAEKAVPFWKKVKKELLLL